MNVMHHRMVGTTVLAAMLTAGCSGGQRMQPFVANGTQPPQLAASRTLNATPQASSYRVLYNFGSGSTDGIYPGPGLIDVHGTLYGSTFGGGTALQNYGGYGTVYSISLTGTERVMHSFGKSSGDGTHPGPAAGLVSANGTLYGTTYTGGTACASPSGCGTVYSVSLTGKEKVIYSFKGWSRQHPSATGPQSALTIVNGTLYGTTTAGGKYDNATLEHGGTVFSVNPTTGAARILHSFGHGTDGRFLEGSLVDVNDTLYGVTSFGGTGGKQRGGYGTVFSMSLTGTEHVLHNFGHNTTDGTYPYDTSGLLNVNGTLYGTTTAGGRYDRGTVFSISPAGTEHIVHVFNGSGDGNYPNAGLISVNGTLYGTTTKGGKYGLGTIFSVSPSGTERVLHDFGHGNDGQEPQGALLDVNGTLYGITSWGGKNGPTGGGLHKYGTVFTLTVPQ
jgi:uncharacterized repeat protein (TIGR03803 family)